MKEFLEEIEDKKQWMKIFQRYKATIYANKIIDESELKVYEAFCDRLEKELGKVDIKE